MDFKWFISGFINVNQTLVVCTVIHINLFLNLYTNHENLLVCTVDWFATVFLNMLDVNLCNRKVGNDHLSFYCDYVFVMLSNFNC